MKKIGVIWLGHPDYLGEHASAVQRATLESLKDLPLVDATLSPIVVYEDEAVAAVREVLAKDCCGVLFVFATWLECNVAMSALKELRGRPFMFWAPPVEEVDGIKRITGAYVSGTMFAGVVRRIGLDYPTLYTSWKDAETIEQIAQFSRAASAVDAMNYAKIGLFGYTSMSIYTGTFDHVLMRYLVGPEIHQMDTYSLINAAEKATPEELADAEARLRAMSVIRSDVTPEAIKKAMALYVALKHFCEDRGWSAVNVKCQYELSQEYKVCPCVSLSLLAEDGITASCEGDILCTVTMLILQLLAQDTVWYADSLTHWDNVLQFSPCGFLPLSMSKGKADITPFEPGNVQMNGIRACGVLRPEKITWARLVEDIGTYYLLYGTGTGIETEPRGGTMPALNVQLDGDIKDLFKEYAGQHYALAYGDWSKELELYASMMGIEARRI